MDGFAVWITGLPGSGKSTIARELLRLLQEAGVEAELLQMDERRKAYFPEPAYTAREREEAYRLFAEEAAGLASGGANVVMDGAAPRRDMRDRARRRIPKFIEAQAVCSLDTAIDRESNRPEGLVMAGLYRKALERRRTGRSFEGLGEVPGVDTPYEENPDAEVCIDTEAQSPEQAARSILEALRRFL
jgi:adenylylsulfate kinase